MSRIQVRLAAVLAIVAVVASCNDSTTAPTRNAPEANFSVTPTTPISQAVTDLIQQIYTGGPRTEVSKRWAKITDKIEAARKKPKDEAKQADVGRKMLADLVKWIQSHTSDVTPPSGETGEHVVARLVLYMSVYAYGDPAAPLPPVPPIGSDAVVTVVDPASTTTVKTPEEQAGISLPQGAVGEPTVLVIYEDAGAGWARCSGPLNTTLCQYPHFYHFDIYPHVRLNTLARVGVCHVLSGPNAPLRDAEHDGRLRVAHDAPADPADNTPNARRVDGIEILPLANISDFLMCNHTDVASTRANVHSGNSLADRGWRALDNLASAAKWLVVPKTAYAIDQGGGGFTLDFSTFEVVDPNSNDAPPPPSDVTAPVVTPVVTGTSSNGWYTSDVGVSWTVTDAESGIISPECANSSVTSNTAGETFTCTATSAGGTTTSSVTIKRDVTPPTVTPNIAGTLGDNGWYTSDIGLTWSVADDLSGLGRSLGCSDVSVASDTDGVTYTCSATNGAGLTTSESVTLKRDATAPSISPDVSGPLGSGGWYTGDVSVSWSVTDASSGVGSSVGCGITSATDDTKGLVVKCDAVDKAGNFATNAVLIRRDVTAPVITPTVTGTLSASEWYTDNVSVSWSVTDATSGVSSSLGCEDASVSEDTDGVTFTCSATDNAGNPGTNSVHVRRDATAPAITGTLDGTLGSGGWYTGNVDVFWAVTDATSGVASKAGCGAVVLSEDTNGTTITCTATDNAGNSDNKSLFVKRDATPPVIGKTVSGTLSATGWYTDNVGVSWSPSDETSGLASTSGCEGASVTGDTDGVTFTCAATDNAGNPGANTVLVKRDATPPVISPTVTGTLGNGGWYTSDVGVSWSVTDPTSGIATSAGCGNASVLSDTNNQTFTCSATNGATLSASRSSSVKRDATPPVIGYAGNAGAYTVDQTVAITCAASDAMSGIATNSCANVGGAAYTFGLGSHGYSAAATDNAGNRNGASATFSVIVTPASLCALTRRFTSDPDIAGALCTKLDAYAASIARGSSTSAAGQIGAYVNQVQAQTGKSIGSANASILISLARAL